MADPVVVAWSEVARWTGVIVLTTGLSWKVRALFGKVYLGQAEGIARVDAVDAKVDRLADHVHRQNGRIKDLEESVMYRDTCTAMHEQSVDAVKRLEDQFDRVADQVLAMTSMLNDIHHLRNSGDSERQARPPGG